MYITVVYLSYVPLGTEKLEIFISSYKKNYSGVSHKLVILFNGVKNTYELDIFNKILKESSLDYKTIISPKKYDIDSYFFISKMINTEFVCFLNTYSIITTPNWLKHLYYAFEDTKVGVVGATGGYGDYQHDQEYINIIKNLSSLNLIKIKKLIYYRFNYYPRILPHIRTNAFMLKTKTFVNLKYLNVRPRIIDLIFKLSNTKLKSLCFEHGNNSMTSQILKMGLLPVIVGRDGTVYEVDQWILSKTFWLSNQENLLIKDNQTMKYALADYETKIKMRKSAWTLIKQK
jgi:hypothetical protein